MGGQLVLSQPMFLRLRVHVKQQLEMDNNPLYCVAKAERGKGCFSCCAECNAEQGTLQNTDVRRDARVVDIGAGLVAASTADDM